MRAVGLIAAGPLLGLAALSGVAGCGPGVARVDTPTLTGAASLVIGVERDARVELHAIDLDAGEPALRLEVESLGDYALYAVVYQETLADLGLTAGPIPVVADEPSKPLEAGLHEYVVSKDADGRPVTWALAESRPSWLASARVRGAPSPCTRFAVVPFDAVPMAAITNEWTFAAAAGDRVVAGTGFGELYHVDAQGHAVLLEQPDQGLLRPTASAAQPDGTLWIGDELGRLWRGAVDAEPKTWTLVSALTPVGGIDFMDVAPDGSEVLVLARFGTVAVYTPRTDTWRVVRDVIADEELGTQRRAGVVWLGPDDYLAGFSSSKQAVRMRGNAVEYEDLNARAGITSMRRVPGVGIVAGTGEGELFVRESARWLPLPDSGSRLWVLGTAAFGASGLVFGSPYGSFGYYPTRDAVCPLTAPVSFFIRFIVPIGDRLVLLGESLAPPAPGGAVLVPR